VREVSKCASKKAYIRTGQMKLLLIKNNNNKKNNKNKNKKIKKNEKKLGKIK
jgi:hypothetical protein